MGAMTVIYVAKPDWTDKNEEYWWSITYPDGRVRPAYTQVQGMAGQGQPLDGRDAGVRRCHSDAVES